MAETLRAKGRGFGGATGRRSRVRLWRGRGGRRRGTGGGVLVAGTVAAVGGQGVGVHWFVWTWSQEGFARRWHNLAGLGTQDESGLILLLKVGRVLHHGLAIGDGELVGAVRDEIEAAGDEDDRQREHGNHDEGETHGQGPGRVALEALLSLQAHRQGHSFVVIQTENQRKRSVTAEHCFLFVCSG